MLYVLKVDSLGELIGSQTYRDISRYEHDPTDFVTYGHWVLDSTLPYWKRWLACFWTNVNTQKVIFVTAARYARPDMSPYQIFKLNFNFIFYNLVIGTLYCAKSNYELIINFNKIFFCNFKDLEFHVLLEH